MSGYRTPPHDGPTTPPGTSGKSTVDGFQLATPASLKWESPKPKPHNFGAHFAALHTQKDVDANPTIKRLQQDLLILTSFNNNTSLHWRPAWFDNERTSGTIWTLHNPPNVVTEPLPNDCKGIQLYTRRMRRTSDPPPQYIKDWDHWVRCCDIYGIPHDFLSEDQVRLMRMGLPRAADGSPRTPPQYPLYPEPSPEMRYVLEPSVYSTHLPRKFQQVTSEGESRAGRKRSAASLDDNQHRFEHVVVEPDGKLEVMGQENCSSYPRAGKRYRWSHLPWTIEMEESCRPLKLKVRLWNETRDQNKKQQLSG